MVELESRDTFNGVSITPNIFSRAYGIARWAAFVAIGWWFARCGGDWSAQPADDESENALYFH